MNINRFIRNFLALREGLQTQNFSTKELNSLCMQGAIEYEKLHLQEAQNAMQEEQIRAKVEIEYLNAQYTLQNTKANTLNTLIQCQSMIKSLRDNAAINRANAYVSFLQVVGNATNSGGISAHSGNVIKTINEINLDSKTDELEKFLDKIADSLNNLASLQEFDKGVQIYAPSLETLPAHPLRLYAFSTLKNAQNYFIINDKEKIEGNTMLFRQEEAGRYKVEFVSQNQSQEAKTSIEILVSDENLRGLH